MTHETGERSFDNLAKALATKRLSRGQVLRYVGGAVVGAALAWVPGVPVALASSAHWGEFQKDYCTSFGLRQYSAILWDIPWGQSWYQACKSTPATIEGQQFSGANRCPKRLGRQWGEFDVRDASCGCSILTTKTACPVPPVLWCRDYCGIAQDGVDPVSGWYPCGVCLVPEIPS